MISKLVTKYKNGFTLMEILITIAIVALITGIILTTFVEFRQNKALEMDSKVVVEVLREARSRTLTSKNASQYGVHFSASAPQITLFTGNIYVDGSATNEPYTLFSTDNILTITLAGGGSDVVFSRLTGETSQSGTIVVSSPTLSKTKNVTINKTGSIDSQ